MKPSICSLTVFAISSSLNPTLFLMERVIASFPFTLEKLEGSLNVLFIWATSPSLTTFEPDALIGRL